MKKLTPEERQELLTCRESFVALYKEEQSKLGPEFQRHMRGHPTGPEHGFGDVLVQGRWKYFKMGWFAKLDHPPKDAP